MTGILWRRGRNRSRFVSRLLDLVFKARATDDVLEGAGAAAPVANCTPLSVDMVWIRRRTVAQVAQELRCSHLSGLPNEANFLVLSITTKE
ncbi:hypothetical protein [Paracoccus aminovorans]|uniref:hypothetical protein n=1 Tax=Paracoccus aminovorans TaxID=34004 RepID=UPI002B25ECCC|nr:hypothetical protein [Paracoccus aminovorans]